MRKPQTILITGASSGLGEALACAYAAPGITLHLSGRNSERLQAVATRCTEKDATVHPKCVDVSDDDAMREWIHAADTATPLDLVIANAGISGGTAGGSESEQQVRQIFTTNINGVLNTLLPIIPAMQQRKHGQIAIMASLAGFRGMAAAPAYNASKGAVKLYGEGLRSLLAADNISVSVICPGFVKTAMTDVNSFPMPFLMEADKATRIIQRGLKQNKARIAFPLPMLLAAWGLATLPVCVGDRLLNTFPAKSAANEL